MSRNRDHLIDGHGERVGYRAHRLRRLRVRAALRAATERPARPLVRTAFRAAPVREATLRRAAARFDWRESAA